MSAAPAPQRMAVPGWASGPLALLNEGDPEDAAKVFTSATLPLALATDTLFALYEAHGEDWQHHAGDTLSSLQQPSGALLTLAMQWRDAAESMHAQCAYAVRIGPDAAGRTAAAREPMAPADVASALDAYAAHSWPAPDGETMTVEGVRDGLLEEAARIIREADAASPVPSGEREPAPPPAGADVAEEVMRFAIRTVLDKLVKVARQTVAAFGTRPLTPQELRQLAEANGLAIIVDPTSPFRGDVYGAPLRVVVTESPEESDVSRYAVAYALESAMPWYAGGVELDGAIATAFALLGCENSPAVLAWASDTGRVGSEAAFRLALEAADGKRHRLRCVDTVRAGRAAPNGQADPGRPVPSSPAYELPDLPGTWADFDRDDVDDDDAVRLVDAARDAMLSFAPFGEMADRKRIERDKGGDPGMRIDGYAIESLAQAWERVVRLDSAVEFTAAHAHPLLTSIRPFVPLAALDDFDVVLRVLTPRVRRGGGQ